jgi:hypothetical protein
MQTVDLPEGVATAHFDATVIFLDALIEAVGGLVRSALEVAPELLD